MALQHDTPQGFFSQHSLKIIPFLSAVLILWLTGFPIFLQLVFDLKPESPERTADAVVVLTGGKSRIEEGLKLFSEGRTKHLHIAGVHPDVSAHDIAKKWTGTQPLPPCCMSMEQISTTTIENAEQTHLWLEKYPSYRTIRLVTSDYHMYRAIAEMEHALPGVEIISHPVKTEDASFKSWHFWRVLLGEYNKTIFRLFVLIFI